MPRAGLDAAPEGAGRVAAATRQLQLVAAQEGVVQPGELFSARQVG